MYTFALHKDTYTMHLCRYIVHRRKKEKENVMGERE